MNEQSQEVEAYVAAVLKRIPRATRDRDRIAQDVRMHLLERVEAGGSVRDALQQMGTPEEVARAYLQEIHLPLASISRRAGAFVIDLLVGAVVVAPAIVFWMGLAGGSAWAFDGASLWWTIPFGLLVVLGISAFFLSIFYFPALEAHFGQTLGKRLLGLCVTTERGEQIGLGAAVLRRLPFFLEFFWLDALFALFTRRRQRAFDMVAKTLVVRCS